MRMIERLRFIADDFGDLVNPFCRANHEEQIAKLEVDIFARRELDLGASYSGHYYAAGRFEVQFFEGLSDDRAPRNIDPLGGQPARNGFDIDGTLFSNNPDKAPEFIYRAD